jgi:hypothetical protein
LRLGDLSGRHLGGQFIAILAGNVMDCAVCWARRRQAEPHVGLHIVLRHAATEFKHRAKRSLRKTAKRIAKIPPAPVKTPGSAIAAAPLERSIGETLSTPNQKTGKPKRVKRSFGGENSMRPPLLCLFFFLLLSTPGLAGVKETVASLAPQGLVLVVDANGNELLAQNADEPFVPASVTKIVTAWMAMETLGGDYRFEAALFRVVAGSIPSPQDSDFVGNPMACKFPSLWEAVEDAGDAILKENRPPVLDPWIKCGATLLDENIILSRYQNSTDRPHTWRP